MKPTKSERIASENARIWEYVNNVLSNDELLQDLGLHRADIERVVIFFRAGDRLHPTQGFDFLGKGWKGIPDDEVDRRHEQRNRAVEKIMNQFLRTLAKQGYPAARDFAIAASEYQVLFVGSSSEETAEILKQMFDNGIGENELSDNFLEKIGSYLVFGYTENLSYYMRGDDFRS